MGRGGEGYSPPEGLSSWNAIQIPFRKCDGCATHVLGEPLWGWRSLPLRESTLRISRSKSLPMGCHPSPYGVPMEMSSTSSKTSVIFARICPGDATHRSVHWDAVQFLRNSCGGATHSLKEFLLGMPFNFLQEAMWDATHVPGEFPWAEGWRGATHAFNARLERLQRYSKGCAHEIQPIPV